jgi:hypothetical protein
MFWLAREHAGNRGELMNLLHYSELYCTSLVLGVVDKDESI